MKIAIITAISFLFCSLCYGSDLIGKYVAKPEVFPGIVDDGSEQYKDFHKRMIFRLNITKNHVDLYLSDDIKPLVMSYEIIGDFLLCKYAHSEKIDKYTPYYIHSDGSLHGSGMIFFRIEH